MKGWRPYTCKDCGEPSRGVRCLPCRTAARCAGMKRCACGKALRYTNVSGLCGPCICARRIAEGRARRKTPPRPVLPPFLAQQAIEMASQVFLIPKADLLGQSRFRWHVEARHAIMAALHRRGMGPTAIGRRVGGRDHSTARYGIDRAEALALRDPKFAAAIERIAA